MTVELPTIAILGAGSMGGAILSGLVAPGVKVAGGIRATNRSEVKAAALRADAERLHYKLVSYSTDVTPDANRLALAGARVVIVGVKPAMVADLLKEIAGFLEPDAIVVSVAAGVRASTMEALVPSVVVRAMPNTPAIVGRAVTGISAGMRASAADIALARQIFETVGTVIEVMEDRIDALSTISGSGPAYVYLLIEQLTITATRMGFSAEEARVMVNDTFLGAAELLAATGSSPAELRRQVTSPKGTTERAIAVLQDADLAELFDRATAAALVRAGELAAGA